MPYEADTASYSVVKSQSNTPYSLHCCSAHKYFTLSRGSIHESMFLEHRFQLHNFLQRLLLVTFRQFVKADPDGVIKWKQFLRYWPFVRGFTGHRWNPRAMASDAELWCFLWSAPWINGWINNPEASNLRRQRAHCDVIAMSIRNKSHIVL